MDIDPSKIPGLMMPPASPIPGLNIPQPNSNPYNRPPASMASAFDQAKQLGHISEQQLLQNALSSIVNSIEQTKLRPLQRQSFMCSANCCDDLTATTETFQRCLQKCNIPVQRANQGVKNELQRFQARIQRQAQECQESARDMQMGGGSTSDAQNHMNECQERIFAQSRGLIPELRNRLNLLVTPKA